MTPNSPRIRAFGLACSMAALSACTPTSPFNSMDWDLRGGNGVLDTSEAALQATARRPSPDSRGVISYPGYQVVVARRGDTVASVAARIGLAPDELARYNALMPTDPLRDGEILALPRRVEDGGRVQGLPAAGATVSAAPGSVDVSAIATTALDRVGTPTPPATKTTPRTASEPVRHQVRRGETAFSIARLYNVSAKALGDWNGLGSDLTVREGQYLIIPVANAAPPATAATTAPGTGSPTPVPPSAAKPLPEEKTTPAAQKPKETPPSPDLGAQQTGASASKMQMPVAGAIIRPYAKGKNDGIDISAPAGSPVKAANAGTVAAITKDTEQTPIIVIRHDGNLLTVYAGVDAISVKKGDKVSRGQTIAKVRAATPSFLHFEVRRGVDSTDPMPFLQ